MKEGEKMQNERLIYSVEEAAKLLGISKVKMYDICHTDGFPAIFVGRSIKIPKAEFKEWISNEAKGVKHGNKNLFT